MVQKKLLFQLLELQIKLPEAANEIGTYLALSLHAPTDDIREMIMPINKNLKSRI